MAHRPTSTGRSATRQAPKPSTAIVRALSKLGYCSRTAACRLVGEGRVMLNGAVCSDPLAPIDISKDVLQVDGHRVRPSERVYLMLNKPRGLITSTADEKGRDTVYSLLDSERLPWLAPVGRLDKASEGLLLLTNDSAWAARVTHPESNIDKTYHVQVNSLVDDALLARIRNGVRCGAGELLQVKAIHVLRHGSRNSWLAVTLDEGRNRHLRRIMQGLKLEVLRLIRVAIGQLQLGDLPKGQTRRLSAHDLQAVGVDITDQSRQQRLSRPYAAR